MSKNQRQQHNGRDLTSSGEPVPPGVATQLGEVARLLQAEPDLARTLQGIVEAAVEYIPGADVAGITVVNNRGEITAPAVTDDVVTRVDRLQYTVEQGPCLSSLREAVTVRADDLRTETRWPLFAHSAAELGVLSMLAFQLYVKDIELGSLNLYSRAAGGFDQSDEEIGLLFAGHAAIAMADADREENLLTAVNSRDLIGQAKGILMERRSITASEAFHVLLSLSQNTNRKVNEIAAELVRTRALPKPVVPGQRDVQGSTPG